MGRAAESLGKQSWEVAWQAPSRASAVCRREAPTEGLRACVLLSLPREATSPATARKRGV